MKKLITIPTLCIAASGLFGSTLTSAGNNTSANSREFGAGEQVTIASDGVVMKHSKPSPGGPRHFDNFVLDTGVYTNTQFIIAEEGTGASDASYSNHQGCVAFNGATFKSSAENGNQYKITVSATANAKKIGIFSKGFTVDNVTVDFNLAGQSAVVNNSDYIPPAITVKNNGVLNYRGASSYYKNNGNSATILPLSLTIEQGSVFNAYFDDNGTNNIHLKNSTISGVYKSGREKRSDIFWYGTNTISNQTAGENAMYVNGRFSLEDASLTIGNSEEKSIVVTAEKYLIIRGTSTLILNSKNALAYKSGGDILSQDNIILQIGNSSNANIVLGADNDFHSIMYTASATQSRVVTLTLDGHKLSLKQVGSEKDALMGANEILLIKDFAENLLKIDTINERMYDAQTGLLSNIKWGEDKDTAKDLYWNKSTGYITAIAIPEPSTYAVIFGALALGFVAYRRRK